MERIICIAIGYICGLFQTGYLIGKLNHIDIRSKGSGNAGSTNALRVMGVKAGFLTLLGDCMKCVLAVIICRLLFQNSLPDELPLLSLYAGVGATLGHNYPCWLKFKGGKGIAVLAAIYLITNPWMTLSGIVVFVGVVALTRYVSLGSLLVSLLYPIELVIIGQMGIISMTANHMYELYAVGFFICALAWWRHRANIVRLSKGCENKFGKKS